MALSITPQSLFLMAFMFKSEAVYIYIQALTISSNDMKHTLILYNAYILRVKQLAY